MGSHEPAADSSATPFICFQFRSTFSISIMSGGSSVRAPKSGFAAQAQAKINSKYSESHAQEVLEWIRELTGEPDNVSGDPENVYEHLRDGTLLCKLANEIQPGTVKSAAEQDGVQMHGKHQHVFGGCQDFRSAKPGTFPDSGSVGKAEPQLRHHLPPIARTQGIEIWKAFHRTQRG